VALPLGALLVILVPLGDLVLVALGLALIVGRNPFMRLQAIAPPRLAGPLRQAFVYGVVLGPVALPCAGAFLVALLATALDPLDAGVRLATFVAFGVGFGAPLLALSFLSSTRSQAIARQVARHHRVLDVVGGLVLVVIGLVDLSGAWSAARPVLGV
jgi:cytochrome c-type biogenesis protein